MLRSKMFFCLLLILSAESTCVFPICAEMGVMPRSPNVRSHHPTILFPRIEFHVEADTCATVFRWAC